MTIGSIDTKVKLPDDLVNFKLIIVEIITQNTLLCQHYAQ